MSNTRIAFIGAGNMAASLIGGLRAKGLDASLIRASDPGEDTRTRVSAGVLGMQRTIGCSPSQLFMLAQVMPAAIETTS